MWGLEERGGERGPGVQHSHFEGVFREEKVFGGLKRRLLSDVSEKVDHAQLLQEDLADLKEPLVRGTLPLEVPCEPLPLPCQIHHIGEQLGPPLVIVANSPI